MTSPEKKVIVKSVMIGFQMLFLCSTVMIYMRNMMKYASIAAILAVSLSVSFVSCKKEEQSTPSRVSVTGTPIVGSALTFKSDGSNVTKYSWDFGDSTTSDQASPSHTYAKPGNYDVLLMLNGKPSTVSWMRVTIHKDPVHTKKIGSMWRWTHQKHDVRTGLDSIGNDTSFSVTCYDALRIAIDESKDTFAYNDDASIDTVLVFGRKAHGVPYDQPDTIHSITFYATRDSIIYTITPGYMNVKMGKTTTFRTRK
jgi:hypothetical protein